MTPRSRFRRVACAVGGIAALLSSLAHAQPSGDMPAGKAVYERLCVRCHGTGGWGDGPRAEDQPVPPANFHSPIVQGRSDEQLKTAIEFGLAFSSMHGWRGALTDEEMRDVVAYIRFLTQRAR